MTSRNIKKHLAYSASIVAFAFSATAAVAQSKAQSESVGEEIVVTGIRASLDRAIDIKRNSNGVVDAISAEDIGKFPDTNLAESLQRITGVSISRINGEGSEVTVRGFGGGYNLVTLNGRTMPAANIQTVGGDQSSDYSTGTSRSFDFSNLASESVKVLEVYKTSRASVASGGIGAAINITTRRPLDQEGFSGSFGAKALYDLSTERGARITPELSGLVSWSNPSQTFGIGLFGSYQKRNNSAPGATVNEWNVERLSKFLDPTQGRVTATTVIGDRPSGDPLIAFPNDSRYEFSEFRRERINGQLVVQAKPADWLTLTADASYFQNKSSEQRTDQANWFNRPFSEVRFEKNALVPTTVFLRDTISGTKDGGFEQQYRATKDRIESYGLNANIEVSDRLRFNVDGHISTANSGPDNPLGHNTTFIAIAHKGIAGQTLDMSTGFPRQVITFNDNPATGGAGNGNGILDVADLGTQVARSFTSRQRHQIKEIRADGTWDLDDNSRFDFGANYRMSSMNQGKSESYRPLGDWGVSDVGDVNRVAPGLATPFCLTCKLKHFNAGTTGASLVAFRADATKLVSKFFTPAQLATSYYGFTDNTVDENIFSAYAQLKMTGEIAGRKATFVAGVRYEKTKVFAKSLAEIPGGITWKADNDFIKEPGTGSGANTERNSYDNILPALDFQIDLTDNLVGRASFGKTLARPDYGSLFASIGVDSPPNRPTLFGGSGTGSGGNTQLSPLISDNIDVSLEWYFAKSSYLSVGFFEKRVANFVGSGVTKRNLFGLRDASSGAAGTRSGAAKDALNSIGAGLNDVNLFTMTALIANSPSVASAISTFQANLVGGNLTQSFIDATLAQYDVVANATDPLYIFDVTQPLNNKQANIRGFEIAGQYFLGETGFGIAAAYTKVSGNVGVDVNTEPGVNVFALLGLSDTANATLIYDKAGISARVAYNWRGKYLSAVNRGSYTNPVFVAPLGQLDFNISYDITPNFAVSIEGLNLTKASSKTYARSEKQIYFVQENDSRFLLGARYKF
jgi:TonB-dependent receptor